MVSSAVANRALAQGNQGPEGIHQDREKRAKELAQCLKDHYKEKQEERHH